MKKQQVYSSKNVILVVVVFSLIFWLLYSIGTVFHKSKKIEFEIEEIRNTNEKLEVKIEETKKQLEYSQTKERVEKEAKIQMGKKLEGEKVLVFVEEKLEMTPFEPKFFPKETPSQNWSNWEKWQWVFWGKQ